MNICRGVQSQQPLLQLRIKKGKRHARAVSATSIGLDRVPGSSRYVSVQLQSVANNFRAVATVLASILDMRIREVMAAINPAALADPNQHRNLRKPSKKKSAGGVEEWRGGDVCAAPFPLPAHQTGRADFPASGFRTKVMSCFRPREVGCGSRQLHQSQRSVKVFVRITASSGTSDFMFPTQPLTQPITAMSVHCAIRLCSQVQGKSNCPNP